jgi:hypothetical protein
VQQIDRGHDAVRAAAVRGRANTKLTEIHTGAKVNNRHKLCPREIGFSEAAEKGLWKRGAMSAAEFTAFGVYHDGATRVAAAAEPAHSDELRHPA